jgi:MFS family permease
MRIALAGLAALAVAMGIGRFAFTPVLPMMLQDAGLTVAQGGWLASANYLGYLAGALWAGAMPVRASTAIRAGLAAIVLGTLAMGFDAGLAAWSVLRCIAGIASAWVLIHTAAWCLERMPATRPILRGTLFSGVGFGIVLAGVLCVLLMARHASASVAWFALGAAALAITAAIWPVFTASGGAAAAHGPAGPWTRAQLILVLAYFAYGFGYIIPATFLPVMARQIIDEPAVFGWAWPLFGAAAAASTFAVTGIARRSSDRAAWIGSHLVMAAGVAAPVFWPGPGGILVAALCVGGTFVVITQVGLQEARTVAGPHAARRLMAAMTAGFAAGQILGPLSVSFFVGAGGFTAALLIACVVLIAGAGALLIRPSGSSP